MCQEAGDGVHYLLGCSISSLFPFLGETSSVSCSELSAEYIGPLPRHKAAAETQGTGVSLHNKAVLAERLSRVTAASATMGDPVAGGYGRKDQARQEPQTTVHSSPM